MGSDDRVVVNVQRAGDLMKESDVRRPLLTPLRRTTRTRLENGKDIHRHGQCKNGNIVVTAATGSVEAAADKDE